ncbi:MAG: UDP-N-acetylmuramate--L-alanine ligase [bacterium ADurb.Bin236]|nr:MAG: UDP-N-acetylmuramate--L-alanine ligase [bacterium ADurb.Bin236]HOY61806.1 Mur ligase family protein [bacterium]HPN94789.1 Mur ligase family protein [bacterium]
MANYFFIGIGGSGMSPIAQTLAAQGHGVCGSDRNNDRGLNQASFDRLKAAGIKLFPQDGSGVAGCDFVVASSAIEDTVPDMARARELGIRTLHRSQALAGIFNEKRGVAAGGTSGKTTICGMTGALLTRAGLDPSIINGGVMKNFAADGLSGSARAGASDIIVIESDESDGSIANYAPAVSIVSNITKDHKPIDELVEIFGKFVAAARELAVLNTDCPKASALRGLASNVVTYGLKPGADIVAERVSLRPFSASFTVDGVEHKLQVPGAHNVSNALAAIAVGRHFGLDAQAIRDGVEWFSGIARRFDLIGEARGVKIIDDFGHNPDKIRATLEALDALPGARHIVFQPHGFGPTKFMRDELVETFAAMLRPGADILYMPEIFYAGGSADKSISSADIIGEVEARGADAKFFATRAEIAAPIAAAARPGDIVVVMGARDDTLPAFCRDILAELSKTAPAG